MKKTALLFFSALLCISAQAQFRYGYFRAGISAGATNYLGDLDDDFTFKFTKPGFGVNGAYRFHPHMEARVAFVQGWIGASDATSVDKVRKQRLLSFRSPITEGSVTLIYDMFPQARGYRFRAPFNPYIFGGVGLFKFNPKAKFNGQWYELQPLGTEGQYLAPPVGKTYPKPYALTQVCLPVGAGAHIMLNRRWDLDVEIGWRKIFTDYLDDVSTRWPDLTALAASNPRAAALSWQGTNTSLLRFIRGDKKQHDWYIYSGVTVSYIIDWVKCPKFKPMRRR